MLSGGDRVKRRAFLPLTGLVLTAPAHQWLAAHAADDRQLGASILGEMAYHIAHHGKPAEAATLVESALAGVRGQQAPRLLAQLYIQQAHAYVAIEDVPAATAAISRARTQAERLTDHDTPPYLSWMRPAEITASSGECLLRLGQADQAAVLIDRGLSLFDPSFNCDRQYYLTHLAEAWAHPGKHRDLEAAAAHGIEAIDLAETVSSPLNADRIGDLSRKLRPYASVPAVQNFQDRAQAFAAA